MFDVTNKSVLVLGLGNRGRTKRGRIPGCVAGVLGVDRPVAAANSGLSFHDDLPVVARRAKRPVWMVATVGKIPGAGNLFTPCTAVGSLLEALPEAAKCASVGDVVLLSPACSSFDQFRNYQQRGGKFCTALKSISGGLPGGDPNRDGQLLLRTSRAGDLASRSGTGNEFAPGFFEGKPRRKKTEQHLNERTLNCATRK